MATNIGPRIGIEGEAEYRRQIQNIIQSQKTLNSEMKMTESAFGKNASAQEKAAARSKILQKEVKNQEERVRQLTAMLKASEQAFGENDTRTLKWKAALQDAATELNRLNTELQKNSQLKAFGDDLQSAGQSISSIGDKIATIGTTTTAAITTPIVAAGTAAVNMAMDFETSLAKVATIADDTQLPMNQLKTQIMDLSTQTGMSASDIAEATYQAISAGRSTGEAVTFVANASKLAKAGFTDVTTSVDTLTTILNAYGLSADQTDHVMNNLITTQNLGKTTVAQLGQSLGTVIPTAAMFGVNLDQISAAYVTMTKNGINTAEATTFLNGALNELGKSGTTASDLLKEKTGKSFSELMASGMSLSDVIGIVQRGADEAGFSIADMFGNQRAAKAAGTLTQHADDFNNALQAMKSNAGATDEAFAKVADTTQTKITKAMNNLKNTGIEVGETVLPTVAKVAEQVGEAVKAAANGFDRLSESQKETVIKAAGAAAAFGPVTTAVGKTTVGIGKLTTAVGAGISKFAEAGGTIGLLVANIGAVAAVGGLAALAYATWKAGTYELTEEQKALNEQITATQESVNANDQVLKQLSSSIGDTVTAAQKSGEKLNFWKEQLNSCFDATGQLIEGMEQTATYALGQLNEAMGTDYTLAFVTSSGNAVNALRSLNEEIDHYVLKMQAQAIAASAMDQYTTALQAQQTAQTDLVNAANQYSEALGRQAEAYAKFQEENAKGLSGTANNTAAINEAKRAYDAESEAVKKAGDALASAGSQYEQATATINGLTSVQSDLAAGTEESVARAQEAYANLPMAAQEAAEGVKSANDVMNANTESAIGQLEKTLGKEIVATPPNYVEFIESGNAAKAEVEKTLSNLTGTVSEVTGGAEAGKKSYSETDAEIGKSHIGKIAEIVGGIDAAMKSWNDAQDRIAIGHTGNVKAVTGGTAAGAAAYNQAQAQTGRGNTGKLSQITGAASAAANARSTAQSFFNNNPVIMTVKQVVQNVVSAVTKHADGGFVDREQLSWLAEGNKREVVIPLQANRARALQLYRQAGKELGVRADYVDLPMVGSSNQYDYGGINVNVYPAQGQSEEAIADAVMTKLNRSIREKRGVFA